MNHCRDCNSDYEKPGTCNCFAVGGKRWVAPQPTYVPYVPSPTWVPHWERPYTPWWQTPYRITVTAPETTGFVVWNNQSTS